MTAAEPGPPSRGQTRFVPIEGLRGYMALWVAISHALQLSGYLDRDGPLGVLTRGADAVAVFIMVSGFVITHLLLEKREPYGRYITRRFFRLFPVYAVLCTVGFLLTDDMVRYVSSVSWADAAFWREYRQAWAETAASTRAHLPWHVLAHATMLHGVPPREWLPYSEQVFLPPAWSISLEWQFYLLAPLLLAGAKRTWSAVFLAAVFSAGYVAYKNGVLGTFGTHTVLLGAAGYFAVGIASRVLLPLLAELRVAPLAAAGTAVLAVIWFVDWTLPLIIWMTFLAYMLYGRREPVTGGAFRLVMENRFAKHLGRISYSVYLSHFPIMIAVGAAALTLAPNLSRNGALVLMIGAVLLTLPISWCLHVLVERPGIRLGAWIASRLPDRKGPGPAAPDSRPSVVAAS